MIHDEHADLDVAYASKRRMIMVMLMVVEVLHGMPKIHLDVFLFLFCAGFYLFGPLLDVTFQFCRLRGGCVMFGLLLSVALLFAGCCCWLCSTSFCLLCCGLAGVRLCLHVVVLGMLCRLRALGTFCDLLCLHCL